MIRVLLALLLMAHCVGCNGLLLIDEQPKLEVTSLNHARFLHRDSARPPALSDPGWKEIELPDIWGPRSLLDPGGYYHLRWFTSQVPDEVYGLYFRLQMNAAVYVNGAFLGDGGRLDEPMTLNWNTPLYFTIPPALLRPGTNEILVRFRADPGYGWLAPILVGPERILRAYSERRRFLQGEMAGILSFSLAGLGVFMLSIWWQRRQDRLYLWFAGSCLAWACFSAYLGMRNPIVPLPIMRWLAHHCLDWWIVALAGFIHRYLGLARPRLERVLIAVTVLGMVVTACVPNPLWRGHCYRFFHVFTLAAACYLALLVLRAWYQQRTWDRGLLAGMMGVLLLFGCHDWLLSVPDRWYPRVLMLTVYGRSFYFMHYAAPLIFFFLAWHLTRRFVRALSASETLNAELEARVDQARAELDRSYDSRRQLELKQTAAEARERVFRDIHDDLGAKLLSLSIGAESPAQADLARSAMRDLREVIYHTGRGPLSLLERLADWRDEITQRTSAAGLQLDWQQAEDLPDVELDGAAALHLGRILRESVTNLLRHAQARRAEVCIAVDQSNLSVSVSDDGCGSASNRPREGNGMRSLRSRAAALGGEISWHFGSQGTVVRLRVPRARLTSTPPISA